MVCFHGGMAVVGVVETEAVFPDRLRAEDSVVQHAFHAVAVTGILRQSQQVTHNFEVRVCSARRFKAAAGGR